MQRLRIKFARHGATKYLSHLELLKAWERVFRRAGWKLSYSAGFNPHPKISFAAALPVGIAAEADLIEVMLDEGRQPESWLTELAAQLPMGITVTRVEEVPENAPPMQRSLRAAEYVAASPRISEADMSSAIDRVMNSASLPRKRPKDGKSVEYDLRPFVQALELRSSPGGQPVVAMRLRADVQGAGRADEVLRELGLDPAECQITRTRLVLEE